MKITTKGQVTIPQDVREQTGLLPGSEVEFVQGRDGRVYLRKVAGKGPGRNLVERLRGRGQVRMSTDEILNLTRGKR
jgi:antitoxin PrlF